MADTEDAGGGDGRNQKPDDDALSHSPSMEARSIQAIDQKSVHQICSGQVVLTLATAVKELVENSIDAGATTVEIRLKEYGSECIEVMDNGSGVEEKNFEGLTLKHYTSKLSDFSDLISVSTFGFRGEALSSLCALSNMVVVTRHESSAVGTRLEFDADGKIVARTPVPRQRGTTVTLQNLFHTLPVRHREFQRNLKKEFGKMMQVLNAYCLVNTGVRITCSNQTAKGSRSTLVSTSGNAAVKDNIANIFGPKQLQSLLPFEQHAPTEDVCSDFGIKMDACHTDLFSIEGYVSKCEHGKGRSSTDRQFLFINRRPCDAAKILKLINEVYHSYNRHQYPFLVLMISVAKESVDVNVTPDKRQIFVEGEKILLATLKTSLIQMYEPTTSVLSVNLIPHPVGSSMPAVNGSASKDHTDLSSASDVLQVKPGVLVNSENTQDGGLSSLARLKRSFSSAFDRSSGHLSVGSVSAATPPDKQRKLDRFLKKSSSTPPSLGSDSGSIKQYLSSFTSPSKKSQRTSESESELRSPERRDSADVVFIEHTVAGPSAEAVRSAEHSGDKSCEVLSSDSGHICHKGDSEQNLTDGVASSESHVRTLFKDGHTSGPEGTRENQVLGGSVRSPTSNQEESDVCTDQRRSEDSCRMKDLNVGDSVAHSRGSHPDSTHESANDSVFSDTEVHVDDCSTTDRKEGCEETCDTSSESGSADGQEKLNSVVGSSPGAHTGQPKDVSSLAITVTELDHCEVQKRPESQLAFSFQRLRRCLSSPEMQTEKKEKSFSRSFRAKICPTDNQSAEEELQREISKDMFQKMNILGQFNLGFIIVKHGQDLFIVDQHATDEKYNFEMLQRNTVLQSQQLIHPQYLELTASNEIILMDNLHIFKKNGFDFVIDEEAPPTQRVRLKSTPVSKNWNFGKDDIEELIFMLTDSPGIMCRPSRVRMMFASRACRKSIMIGTALNHSEMMKLVHHMGEIEQPWNCPHGRPTMRHLINLDMLPT